MNYFIYFTSIKSELLASIVDKISNQYTALLFIFFFNIPFLRSSLSDLEDGYLLWKDSQRREACLNRFFKNHPFQPFQADFQWFHLMGSISDLCRFPDRRRELPVNTPLAPKRKSEWMVWDRGGRIRCNQVYPRFRTAEKSCEGLDHSFPLSLAVTSYKFQHGGRTRG